MMISLKDFTSLEHLYTYFKSEPVCRKYLEKIRWNGKIICPYEACKHDHVIKFKDGIYYRCAKCKKDFSVKVGSIFEGSKIPLQKWFGAIYLVTTSKQAITSTQLHKDLGVTQTTAWQMLHRLRHTMGNNSSFRKNGLTQFLYKNMQLEQALITKDNLGYKWLAKAFDRNASAGIPTKKRKKLFVSFSGGETSAWMAQWLWNNKRDEYEMLFVFANTGQEKEQTLRFIDQCEKQFGFPVIWLEAKVNPKQKKGTGFNITNYKKADRKGKVFESVIKKYGIPNVAAPHCTREMKQAPISNFARSIGWRKYYTAIGIRIDEMDRMNAKAKKRRLLYPLIAKEMMPMTKPKINFWWKNQPFRLKLKGYQGNCITCWKKADSKLYRIAKENEESFAFFDKMEQKYGNYYPESRVKLAAARGVQNTAPITFFRKNRSAQDILRESRKYRRRIKDDANVYDEIDLNNGSCEVFADCGN